MKSKLGRLLRSASMVALALFVGLASVQVFAGADVLGAAKESFTATAEQNSSSPESEDAESLRGFNGFMAQLAAAFKDEEFMAKLMASSGTCSADKAGASAASAELATCSASAKVAAVASEPATCSAATSDAKVAKVTGSEASTCSVTTTGAKIAKVTASENSTCSATAADAVAKTEAVAAKVASEVPACCADKATDAKVAKVTEAAAVPACCQDKAASKEEADD